MSFGARLSEKLEELQGDHSFQVYNENDTTQFVCGLEADEYTYEKESIVYIAKVDTTANAPVGLAKRLVQAYLAWKAPCTVHVFGRAQPQYLFPASASPKKRTLTDRQLIQWWHSVLATVSSAPAHWSIPGIDDRTEACLAVGLDRNNAALSYGYPFPPDAKAADVIPRFSDDAKARVLKELEDDMTVKDFWDILGFSEECGAGKLSAFFFVSVSKNEPKEKGIKNDDDDNNIEDEGKVLQEDAFVTFWNQLMHDKISFEDTAHATKSTARLLKTWKDLNLTPFAFTTFGKKSTKPTQPDLKRKAPNDLTANVLSVRRKKT
ncbi:histone acetylation protein-domain-containing protein [Syncephalastrum racemosum]|uniref:histone acetyltransferase n=1 Tax=Syncephalastrum racemosum TaxID=13706 RepID=A0A1X2H6X1_SYNRA|nr:histone acetylation protein-domain-containing protein [Syncephalastrum racemosum]